MAALTDTHPTLLDLSKRMDPDGKIAKVVELLNATNEILEDMVFLEANDTTGHRTTVRTGLPTPTWRKLYGGVQPTKSRTAQVTESIGMLEAYTEVDVELAKINGNTAAFRFSEEIPHIEGMNQEMAATLFNGNEATEPEAFTGFAPRYNDQTATNAENILTDAATPDSTDNSSIWLVVWGPNTVHGIVPKDSMAGLDQTDLGEQTVMAGDTLADGYYQAYRSHYKWKAGLSVRDWRYVVRIQIDQENLLKDASSGPDLIDLMAQAVELIPNLKAGRPAFYMNRTVRSFLRRQMQEKIKNSTLSYDMIGGKHVLSFDGVPVRRCDALVNNETGI